MSARRTRSQLKQDDKVDTVPVKRVKRTETKSKPKNSKVEDEKDDDDDGRPKYWLLKAEPESRIVDGHDVKFSIDDLKEMKVSPWDGVRNYEARNNMQSMKKGELAFFYHSNCKVPGIVGIMKIAKEAYADCKSITRHTCVLSSLTTVDTAFDTKHPYYDPKSDEEKPRWFMVDVEYVEHLNRIIPLTELKSYAASDLSEMPLVKKGRLSVSPVGKKEWDFILSLASKDP